MSFPAATCPTCGTTLDANGVCGVCLSASFDDEETKFTLPGLDQLEELARGGMGIVYRAVEANTGRAVAVKIPTTRYWHNAQAVQRFMQEARSAALLEHPHVLPVYEVRQTADTPYFTMKLATGGSLADQLKSRDADRGAKFQRWAAEVLAGVAEAVHHAHSLGVLHRDIKPANILFDEAGTAYLSDFGLAKIEEGGALMRSADLLSTVGTVGTAHYLAPEIANGDAASFSASADVYALGSVLYEVFTGSPPHTGETLAQLLRRVADETPRSVAHCCPTLAPDLAAICEKAMMRLPSDRYGSAAEMAADLRRWLNDEPVLARPLPWAGRCVRWVRRYPKAALVMAGALIALVSSIVMLVHGQNIARAGLVASQFSEVRLLRQSTQFDRRASALTLLAQAARTARTAPSEAMRHEAAALFALPDWSLAEHYTLIATTAVPAYSELAGQELFAEPSRVVLRRLPTNEVRWSLPVPEGARCVALQMNKAGSRTAMLYDTGKAELWHTLSNEKWLDFEPCSPRAFRIHPHFSRVVWINKAGELEFENLSDRKQHFKMPHVTDGKQEAILGVGWSPDANTIAVLHEDRVDVLSIPARKLLWSASARTASSTPVFSSDGKKLAVVSRLSVMLLNAKTGELLGRLSGHQRSISHTAWIPNSKVFLTAASDGSIRAWDTELFTSLWELQRTTGVLHPTGSGLGFVTASRDRGVEVWKQTPSPVFREFTGGDADPIDYVYRFTDSPAAKMVVTISNNHVRLWDTVTRKMVSNLYVHGKYGDQPVTRFSDDGKTLYLSRFDGPMLKHSIQRSKSKVTLGEAETMHPASTNLLLKVMPPPSTDWIMWRDELRVWPGGDAAKERPLLNGLKLPNGLVDPSVRWITSGSVKAGDHPVHAISDASIAFTFNAESESKPKWTRDYLTVTSNSRVRLFRPGTWEQVLDWPSRSDYYVGGWIATGADGKLAAIQQERDVIELIDVPHQRLLVRLEPPSSIEIQGLAFSASGDRLFVAGMGHRVYEWDLTKLRGELQKLGLDWE